MWSDTKIFVNLVPFMIIYQLLFGAIKSLIYLKKDTEQIPHMFRKLYDTLFEIAYLTNTEEISYFTEFMTNLLAFLYLYIDVTLILLAKKLIFK